MNKIITVGFGTGLVVSLVVAIIAQINAIRLRIPKSMVATSTIQLNNMEKSRNASNYSQKIANGGWIAFGIFLSLFIIYYLITTFLIKK